MPVPPAELTAHFRIGGPPAAAEQALLTAGPSGIAHDGGPDEILLSGSRELVMTTLEQVIAAAIDAGAYRIDVRLEAPSESR